MPKAVINQPSVAKGRVRSIRNLRPYLSIYNQLIRVPIALTAARGIFKSNADSSGFIPGIVRPAVINMSGP